MARELKLKEEIKIILITKVEDSLSTDKISIDKIEDDGEKVTTDISFFHSSGKTKSLTLWENENYIKIGNWTDEQVNERILELLNIN